MKLSGTAFVLCLLFLTPLPSVEAQSGIGDANRCQPIACNAGLECFMVVSQILIGAVDGMHPDLCTILEGECTCQAGYGDPGSAAFTNPSLNKPTVAHAALYAERNVASDHDWWMEYFEYQKSPPPEGGGFMGKEVFSPVYGSHIVASVMTVLDVATERGHTSLADEARQWLRAYWAISALAAVPGNIHYAETVTRFRTDVDTQGNRNYVDGVIHGTAGPRVAYNPTAHGGVVSTQHPLQALALDVGPKKYNRSLTVNPGFYGGIRVATTLGGFQLDLQGHLADFATHTAPPETVGLTAQERQTLVDFVRRTPAANLGAVLAMAGDYNPHCNMTFRRTSQGTVSWFGHGTQRQNLCNAGKGPLFGVRVDFNERAYFLQPATEAQILPQLGWHSFRQGNQICADVDFELNESYETGPWCIDMPGGAVEYEVSWTRQHGLRIEQGTVPDPPDPPTVTLDAVADAYVRQNDWYGNQGSSSWLSVRDPDSGVGKHSLVRFDVPVLAGTVQSAKLRLRTQSTDIPSVGFYRLANTAWTEPTVSYDNWDVDGLSTSVLDTKTNLAANAWHSFDVGAGVSGNGTVTFALAASGTASDAPGLSFRSRESGVSPVLRVTYGGGQVRTFTAVHDAWVDLADPFANHGTGQELYVRAGFYPAPETRYSFLKFQVTGISGAVQSATLDLRSLGTALPEVLCYRVDGTLWAELGINFDNWNRNDLEITFLGEVFGLAGDTWHEIDVTAAIDGPGPLTLAFATSEDLANLNFYSRESSYKPQLVITYSP